METRYHSSLDRRFPAPGMYGGGVDSVSGSGLEGFAARAARSCLSLSSNCIFDFLSSKNANSACVVSRLERLQTQAAKRNETTPSLSELRSQLSLQPLLSPDVALSRLHVLQIPSGPRDRSGGLAT